MDIYDHGFGGVSCLFLVQLINEGERNLLISAKMFCGGGGNYFLLQE